MYELPILYSKGKSDKILSWKTWADGDTVYTEHGQLDGKKQLSQVVVESKNLGKANETSLEDQAIKECEAQWKHKLTRKYFATIEELEEVIFLPMLAHPIDKHKDKISYPATIQKKLDGVRCMVYQDEYGEIKLLSRGGRFWESSPHITLSLKPIFEKYPDVILDGELYLHGVTFQEVTKMVKKFTEYSFEVDYVIYDVTKKEWNKTKPWSERLIVFNEIKEYYTQFETQIKSSLYDSYQKLKWEGNGSVNLSDVFDIDESSTDVPTLHRVPVQFLEADIVNTEEEIKQYHDKYVADRYEGAIVRLMDYPYIFAYRSHGLLKVKQFDDAEFKVVSFTNGVGKFANSIILICSAHGSTFKVVPKLSQAKREKMYAEALINPHVFVGELYKVKFFGYTDDGIPRFPVGLGFRDKKDM